jgi:hypothetical protein
LPFQGRGSPHRSPCHPAGDNPRRQRQVIPQAELAGAVPPSARARFSIRIDSGKPIFQAHFRPQHSVGLSRKRRVGMHRPVRLRRGSWFRYAG